MGVRPPRGSAPPATAPTAGHPRWAAPRAAHALVSGALRGGRRIALVTLGGSLSLPGADVLIDQWQLAAGIAPGPERITETYTAGAGTTSTRPSGTYVYQAHTTLPEAVVGYERGRTVGAQGLGYLGSLDLALAAGTVPAGGAQGSVAVQRVLPELELGGFLALDARWRVEALGTIGYGLERLAWKDTNLLSGGSATSTTAIALLGALVGVRYRARLGITIGGEIGVAVGTARHRYQDAIGTQSSLTDTTSGPVAHVAIGYRF